MRQRRVGNSGLQVGRIGLGTLAWDGTTFEHEAREILKTFIEVGGTLIDTADAYGAGMAEEMLGELLAEQSIRDRVVLATKAGWYPGAVRERDASRIQLLRSLERSLRRLRTDYLDLWQLHTWDPHTPIDETLAAAVAAVESGKVRYVGVSNYCGWQLMLTSRLMANSHPGISIVSAQLEYSLLERGIEREVAAAAATEGIGLLPWSPLGRGVLTGKYRSATPTDSRAADPKYASFVAPYLDDRCARIVDAVTTAARGLDVHPAVVALAWIRDRPGVCAPIIGVRTVAQLRVVLTAEELQLPEAIGNALDDVSKPALGYPDHGWNQA